MRKPTGAIFLLLACLYALSLGRGFYASDGDVMFHTTAALVQRGTFALDPDPTLPQIVAGDDGRFYGKYDPGLPLLGAPFFALGDWIARVNHAHRATLSALFVLLVPVLAGAGAGGALAALASDLFGPRRAVGIALAAGLATPLWPYARTLFPETVLACALALVVLLIVRGAGRAGGLLAAGAVFGAGMAVRAAFAIYALPLALLIFALPLSESSKGSGRNAPRPWPLSNRIGEGKRGRGLRSEVNAHRPEYQALSTDDLANGARTAFGRLIAFGVGALPFGLLLLGYNTLRFGDPLRFGYTGEGFTTPPWTGIAGLLVSPGKGALFYAPPLALAVVLWPRFRRAQPALAWFLLAAWGVALAFYGTWWAWYGGWSWGPRFLVPLIPLSLLPLGPLPASHGWRIAAVLLVALGIGIQALGVLVDLTPHYAALGDADRALFAPGESPPLAALRRVAEGHTEPLAVFHLADSGLPSTWSVGVPLLCVLGVLAGAWRLLRLVGAARAETR